MAEERIQETVHIHTIKLNKISKRDSIAFNVPIDYMAKGRNDFDAGKSITRAIGKGGFWKSRLFGPCLLLKWHGTQWLCCGQIHHQAHWKRWAQKLIPLPMALVMDWPPKRGKAVRSVFASYRLPPFNGTKCIYLVPLCPPPPPWWGQIHYKGQSEGWENRDKLEINSDM